MSESLPYDDTSLLVEVRTILEQHATRMLSYINKQATLTHAMKSNPDDKAKLQKGLAEQCHRCSVPPLAGIQDQSLGPQELLSMYDKALEKEPTSFEDSFTQLQIAYSASTLYQNEYMSPFMLGKPKSLAWTMAYINHHHHKLPMFSYQLEQAPPKKKVVDLEIAALLDPKNHFDLMTTRFAFKTNKAGRSGSKWKVRSVRLTGTKEAPSWEYGVCFDDVNEEISYTEEDFLDLIEENKIAH